MYAGYADGRSSRCMGVDGFSAGASRLPTRDDAGKTGRRGLGTEAFLFAALLREGCVAPGASANNDDAAADDDDGRGSRLLAVDGEERTSSQMREKREADASIPRPSVQAAAMSGRLLFAAPKPNPVKTSGQSVSVIGNIGHESCPKG